MNVQKIMTCWVRSPTTTSGLCSSPTYSQTRNFLTLPDAKKVALMVLATRPVMFDAAVCLYDPTSAGTQRSRARSSQTSQTPDATGSRHPVRIGKEEIEVPDLRLGNNPFISASVELLNYADHEESRGVLGLRYVVGHRVRFSA